MNEQILLWINQGWGHPALDPVFAWLSDTGTFSIPLLLIIGIFLGVRFGKPGWLITALMIVVVAISDQLANLLKDWLQQARPCLELYDEIRRVDGRDPRCLQSADGMPSSHAMNFFTVFTFVALFLRSMPWTVALMAVATLVSISRVYLAVHFPTQVLVGALLGILLGSCLAWIISTRLKLSLPRSD